MLCKKPFMAGTIPFGCGQCLPCRINRSRQWAWRQFLESLCHDANCFITLTYDPEHLPRDGSLEPEVVRLFLMRLRKQIYPVRVRYFLVGEYGEQSYRPHYHLSLFGLCGHSVVGGESFESVVRRCWGFGFTCVAEFNELTAQYVAGYVVKKLRDRRDVRLADKVPEFARMSRRPGLGAGAMELIASRLNETAFDWGSGDVPRELRVGKRRIPLGRYLLARLREEVGFSAEYSKEVRDRTSMERSVDMLALYARHEGASSFKKAYLEEIGQRLLQVESRSLLFKKRGQI